MIDACGQQLAARMLDVAVYISIEKQTISLIHDGLFNYVTFVIVFILGPSYRDRYRTWLYSNLTEGLTTQKSFRTP